MKSAGQNVPYGVAPQGYGPTLGYGSPQGYGGYPQNYGGYPPGGGMISIPQPQMLPVSAFGAGGGLNMQIKGKELSANQTDALAWGQLGNQTLGMVGNMINSYLNWDLQSKALKAQMEAITGEHGYYATQDKIAGYQTQVAMKQLQVQENAIYVQKDMHTEQIRHEETMTRLEGATQRQLAVVAENAKTDRAQILSVSDAFNRRSRDMGMPAMAS